MSKANWSRSDEVMWMNRFTGNKLTGSWSYQDKYGIWTHMTVEQMLESKDVVWAPADGTGDFSWPHMRFNPSDDPQEMVYNDD